jgi:hypothetical protein
LTVALSLYRWSDEIFRIHEPRPVAVRTDFVRLDVEPYAITASGFGRSQPDEALVMTDLIAEIGNWTGKVLVESPAITSAQVIAELAKLAKELRDAHRRGAELGLSEDELAWWCARSGRPEGLRPAAGG